MFLTAEFHGIWESLVYEGEVKTQVNKKNVMAVKRLEEMVTYSNFYTAELHIVFISLQLLDYVTTTMYFSDKNVDSNLISWNRVVLLHGK